MSRWSSRATLGQPHFAPILSAEVRAVGEIPAAKQKAGQNRPAFCFFILNRVGTGLVPVPSPRRTAEESVRTRTSQKNRRLGKTAQPSAVFFSGPIGNSCPIEDMRTISDPPKLTKLRRGSTSSLPPGRGCLRAHPEPRWPESPSPSIS